jgi:hypothetical protein
LPVEQSVAKKARRVASACLVIVFPA